ncbi:hypothetical protein ACJW30_04G171900 [Castanea mollissima]
MSAVEIHEQGKKKKEVRNSRYGCQRRFLDSDKHRTKPNRFAYIYTKLEISTPFKSDLRFPSPPTTKNPPPFQLLIFKPPLLLLPRCHPGQIFTSMLVFDRNLGD